MSCHSFRLKLIQNLFGNGFIKTLAHFIPKKRFQISRVEYLIIRKLIISSYQESELSLHDKISNLGKNAAISSVN